MEREFGISRGDVEAAEAETARKLAADRAVELESPALKRMNVNVKAVIEVGEGYARCKECFPEAKLFWDIRKTIG